MFFPYSVDAVRLLNRAGFAVVVVTNQAGVARGIFKESFVAEAHRAHHRRGSPPAARRIDAFYYCPHHPEGDRRARIGRSATAASRSPAC